MSCLTSPWSPSQIPICQIWPQIPRWHILGWQDLTSQFRLKWDATNLYHPWLINMVACFNTFLSFSIRELCTWYLVSLLITLTMEMASYGNKRTMTRKSWEIEKVASKENWRKIWIKIHSGERKMKIKKINSRERQSRRRAAGVALKDCLWQLGTCGCWINEGTNAKGIW